MSVQVTPPTPANRFRRYLYQKAAKILNLGIIVVNVVDIVKAGKPVKFVRYQKNELWYVTDCGFEFPVPISDTGDAAFLPEDKPMLLMRWLNAHAKLVNQAKREQEVTIS